MEDLLFSNCLVILFSSFVVDTVLFMRFMSTMGGHDSCKIRVCAFYCERYQIFMPFGHRFKLLSACLEIRCKSH